MIFVPALGKNVILELGYFMGKLGRDGVAILYEGDLEIPSSDIAGVEYIKRTDEWRMKLLQRLLLARMPVNREAFLPM